MDYFGKNRVKIMIIDRIRSTEYPGKREFRLFFVLREKGRYSSLKTLTFCFMIAAAGRGKQKNVWKHFFAALPK